MFSYDEAFSRNIGWVTEAEQQRLRQARVAIGGLGVGGVHLLTLARLGIGRFAIADFDVFDIANFNRQVGATVSSLHRPKIDVLQGMARDINPEVELSLFPDGVQEDTLDEFLKGVDIYVDGLDFFAFSARRMTLLRVSAGVFRWLLLLPWGWVLLCWYLAREECYLRTISALKGATKWKWRFAF